jgi:hypothetical protein
MKITRILAALLLAAKSAHADVVLNEKVMKLTIVSAELSMLAYQEDPPGDGFEHFGYYDEGKKYEEHRSRIWTHGLLQPDTTLCYFPQNPTKPSWPNEMAIVLLPFVERQ